MELIHPGVLYFLPALLIPVIVHFFNFRRYQKVYFSNVRNLKAFASEHRSRNRIREIILMIIRILCLLFLILAFSGLNFRGAHSNILKPGETRLLEVYIDNSQSMNLLGEHGTLLEEVKKKAKELSDLDIPGQGTVRYALLTNDFSGGDFQFLEKEEFLNKLSGIQTSVGHKGIKQILNRFQELNTLSKGGSKQIILFTDLQANILLDKEAKSLGGYMKSFDSLNHSNSRFLIFHPRNQANVFIDSVWNESPIQKIGENNGMVVRVKRSFSGNSNHEQEVSVPIRLILNSEIKSIGLVHFNKTNEVLDTLHFQIQNPGSQEVKVEIDDEPVSFDNTFYASWFIPSSMDIYHVHGMHKSPYISSVYATDPFFHEFDFDQNLMDYNLLSRQNFVILDEVSDMSSGLISELKKLVERGGALVYIPPPADSSLKDLGLEKIRNFMNEFSLDKPIRWVKQDQKMKRPTLNLGLMEGVFDRFPKNLDLPLVQEYLQWESPLGFRSRVWFSLQGNEPYLSQYKKTKGSIWVFSGPFQNGYTNFMKHPFFLPVFYNLAFRSSHSFPLYYTLGKSELYPTENWSSDEIKTAVWKGDTSRFIPEFENRNGLMIHLGQGPQKSGFYHLEIQGKTRQSFAFNYDRDESNLSYYSVEDLGLNPGNQVMDENRVFKSFSSFEEDGRGFSLQVWKVCLILALLFLAIEQALIRIKSPA